MLVRPFSSSLGHSFIRTALFHLSLLRLAPEEQREKEPQPKSFEVIVSIARLLFSFMQAKFQQHGNRFCRHSFQRQHFWACWSKADPGHKLCGNSARLWGHCPTHELRRTYCECLLDGWQAANHQESKAPAEVQCNVLTESSKILSCGNDTSVHGWILPSFNCWF